ACALVSRRSVATTPMVVLKPPGAAGPPHASSSARSGSASANSPARPSCAPYSAPVRGSTALPAALTAASAPTAAPPATSTVPAPHRRVRNGPDPAAPAQVVQARRGHDRHHLALRADLQPHPGVGQPVHDAARRVQPVRRPAAEHDRVHPLHHVPRVEQV